MLAYPTAEALLPSPTRGVRASHRPPAARLAPPQGRPWLRSIRRPPSLHVAASPPKRKENCKGRPAGDSSAAVLVPVFPSPSPTGTLSMWNLWSRRLAARCPPRQRGQHVFGAGRASDPPSTKLCAEALPSSNQPASGFRTRPCLMSVWRRALRTARSRSPLRLPEPPKHVTPSRPPHMKVLHAQPRPKT